MTDKNLPNAVDRKTAGKNRETSRQATRQPNADKNREIPKLFARKRHMSGLLCPPSGAFRTAEGSDAN